MPKLKIAIVVHGRFHAFDLTRALLGRSHDVTIFTNYPRWAVKRFGIPSARVHSFVLHGILSRLAEWLKEYMGLPKPESGLHVLFGRWAARRLKKESWDVVHCWSGISEEILRSFQKSRTKVFLMRGSAHIRVQDRLLEEEIKRTGILIERPSAWIMKREEREYALADHILALSHFSHSTFLECGVPAEKLQILPLGAQGEVFRPRPEVVEARCQRILTGKPLRVLYVGAFSLRKGMWDMVKIVQGTDKEKFHFNFVGRIFAEARKLAQALRGLATFTPSQPQSRLPFFYEQADIYIGPSIEDGFQIVLGQAAMAALPILTTPNGAGADLVKDGETGWILPIRDPQAFIQRLRWCDEHREKVVDMVHRLCGGFRSRSWSDVAMDFEKICVQLLPKEKSI